jgi:hypothetical protein
MTLGRRRTRVGTERKSTIEITPDLDGAILDLQKRYRQTNRRKPSMRDLIVEGVSLLLEREGLPAMPTAGEINGSAVIQMPRKTGA